MSANSAVAIKRSAGVGRYDLCPCGSGRKYKHCCLGKDSDPETAVQRSNLRLFTAAGIRSTHACRSSSPISRQSRLCVGSRGIEFAYRQYERLMEHRRRVLPKDRFTEARYENSRRRAGERDAAAHRLVRARLGRGLSRARAQPKAIEYSEPLAGAPAGLWEPVRALAALRAVARRTARALASGPA